MKTVVTDEMVERVLAHSEVCSRWGASWVRNVLEVALSEPEEIPVTEEMLQDGILAYRIVGAGQSPGRGALMNAYRAMETVRRKQESPDATWTRTHHTHSRKTDVGFGTTHRREGDPK